MPENEMESYSDAFIDSQVKYYAPYANSYGRHRDAGLLRGLYHRYKREQDRRQK